MKFLCFAYEDEQDLNGLSQDEWLELRQERLDSALTAARGRYLEAFPLEQDSECVEDGGLVIDDQDTRFAHGSVSPARVETAEGSASMESVGR